MSDDNTQSDDLDRADILRLAAGQDAALNDLMQRHTPKHLFEQRCKLNFAPGATGLHVCK